MLTAEQYILLIHLPNILLLFASVNTPYPFKSPPSKIPYIVSPVVRYILPGPCLISSKKLPKYTKIYLHI